MNIVTISQFIGPFVLSDFELGTLIVYKYNQLVDADNQIDINYTGNSLYAAYKLLPPAVKVEISKHAILNDQEVIDLTGEVVMLTRHQQELNSRDNVFHGSMVSMGASIIMLFSLLIMGSYLYVANGSGGIHHTALMSSIIDIIQWIFGWLIRDPENPT